ncbi:MAG: hypothetical protein GY714_23495 [Desulfobacterales bacterium]|nr:hypothetical protein [Desulfobacterales bacterium]
MANTSQANKTKTAKTKNVKEEKINKVEQVNKTVKPVNKRKKIDKDLDILIMNNVGGDWVYQEKGIGGGYWNIAQFGDTEIMTVQQLQRMKASEPAHLMKLWVVLVDVYSDDEDITIDDVIKFLGLDKLYNQEIKPNQIDDIILNTTDFYQFNNMLDKISSDMLRRVIDRAVMLYKEGRFNDPTKMEVFKKKMGNELIFDPDLK